MELQQKQKKKIIMTPLRDNISIPKEDGPFIPLHLPSKVILSSPYISKKYYQTQNRTEENPVFTTTTIPLDVSITIPEGHIAIIFPAVDMILRGILILSHAITGHQELNIIATNINSNNIEIDEGTHIATIAVFEKR